MTEIKVSWNNFKQIVSTLTYPNLRHVDVGSGYIVWMTFENKIIEVNDQIRKGTPDGDDFENNYKPTSNILPPLADNNRPVVRTESRPDGMTILWTCRGDSETGIGDGTELKWNFANTENDVTAPTGFKRKQLEFSFLDAVRLKDALLFFSNASHGSYFDAMVVCPTGEYYLKNDGTPALASEDVIISHYCNSVFIEGASSRGMPFDSEGCTDPIPPNYKFWIRITVPDTDTDSTGSLRIEMFRDRNIILE